MLSAHALMPLTEGSLQTTVADFVLEDGSWDWQALYAILPIEICNFIAGLAPPVNSSESDSIAWRGSNDSNFSINSAYAIISGNNLLHADPLFRLIWR